MENYKLVWKKEVIDNCKTKKEAEYLRSEYNLAYGGGVTINKNTNI